MQTVYTIIYGRHTAFGATAGGNPLSSVDPSGEFWVGFLGIGVGGATGAVGSAVAQYAQNGSINWSNVGWSAVTGAITGFALTTPGGATLLGAMGIGGAGGLVSFGLTTPVSNWSLAGAIVSTAEGALGGLVGGLTTNPYTVINVSPALNDSGLVTGIAVSGFTSLEA